MPPSVSDIPWDKLTPAARATLEQIAVPMSDGESIEQIAKRLELERADITDRLAELEAEVTALAGGPTVPAMTPDEFDALCRSIEDHGQLVPILLDGAGRVIDGENRMRACRKLGITPSTLKITDERLTADERRRLALAVNVARRQLPAGARRGFVAAELKRDPSRSDRAIASDVGCSPTFVGRMRRELERAGVVSTVDTRVGRDGRPQRAEKAPSRPRTAVSAPPSPPDSRAPLLREDEILDELRALAAEPDLEKAHARADDLLVEAVALLGGTAIAEAWLALQKWFA